GSVGVVTAIAEGPLSDLPLVPGMRLLDDMEERVRVFAAVTDAVLRTGSVVLNADDPHVLALAEDSHAEVILVSGDANHPQVAEHGRAKGRAVVATNGGLMLLDGERQVTLPLAAGPSRGDALLPILAAVAAAWATSLRPEELRDRLS